MEIIEKKVYEEGGENRRSTRERANAGLTLGIIGTVLGAAALWGRNNGGIGSILGGGTSLAGGGSVPSNVNINSYGGGATGCVAPTPFQAWEKGCEDALALTNEMWRLKVGSMQAISDSREVDVAEKFGLYKTMVDADFGLYKSNRDNIDAVNNRINAELFSLYKYTRDKDDETRKELCDLKAQVAISNAVRPYQDKLIQCEIEKAFTAGINYTDRKTCKMVEGVVVVPTEPTITGIGSYCCFRNNTTGGNTPA
ncbi:MAG TPA: hypothetical protein K8V05_09045 [Butyricimonas virosa]|jgi:hypothetical protein|uniref:Tail protein n=1 Tax=Butyricimonas virosa TaxID=544645 RepID=A0A921H597_9BACT|nr:MAG TPA: hypothetical protein [Caudoviricetes sp.]DAT44534.1 MAG TPA: hypothetical protein [Caudoviricetes sp.]HJF70884.1 hypothetical protein [Butyricimonas virosa]